MITEARRLYTAEQYAALPDIDGVFTELANGEIIEVPHPDSDHSLLSGWILTLLNNFVVPRRLGIVLSEQGAYLLFRNPDTVRALDVSFMRRERMNKVGLYYLGAPDIAIEIISPGNSQSDLREKMDEYFRGGSQRVWLVYMKSRVIDVFTAGGATTYRMGDTIDMGAVLPGFTLTLDETFSILEQMA